MNIINEIVYSSESELKHSLTESKNFWIKTNIISEKYWNESESNQNLIESGACESR